MKNKILILISLTTSLMMLSQSECNKVCIMQVEDYKLYTNTTYSGCVNENQEYHGEGVLLMVNETASSTYDGCWKNGKKNGYGEFKNNEIWYKGDWKNGKMHGEGYLIVFKKPYNGIHDWSYDGEFYKNEMHGQGTLAKKNEYSQAIEWTGIWEEDERKDGYWNFENYYNPEDINIKNSETGTIPLPQDKRGREYVNVLFNNLKTPFLYDTGADIISINQKLLGQLKSDNVQVNKLGITRELISANGHTTKTEVYSINKLTVGNIEVKNVIVCVWPDANGDNLLGEEFWNKFSRTTRCIDSDAELSEITIYK
jgi:clan AA aspartic protease (TIGR02281 family)